jgi:hypothetical protein
MIRQYFIALTAILFLTTCEKDNVPRVNVIGIKNHYSADNGIFIELSNTSDSMAYYYICSGYDGIPPVIEKLNGNNWTGYFSPLCDGYLSHCCAELPGKSSCKDTIQIEFENGTYRIGYEFIVRPGHDYESFYSKPFRIE